ncbi:MAG: hypothetical protein JXB05_37810 [Myxococcaceae bacterium]|nr:hypothetical protein [Myxococcaceae bacterium]
MNVARGFACQLALLVLTCVGTGCSVNGEAGSPAAPAGRLRSAMVSVPASQEACGPVALEPTRLLYLGPTEAEYGDTVQLTAWLTDGAGQPLAGRAVRFVLGTQEAIGTTDALGHARVTLTIRQEPAALPLTVEYAGDATTGPSSATATVALTKADTVTRILGPTLLGTGAPVQVRASLASVNDRAPLAGRALVFEVGGVLATGLTDEAGVATATLSWSASATGPAILKVSFAGDAYYLPSASEAPVMRYQPTAFTLWGGNTPGLALGQQVNFWGHSWPKQVTGGAYAAQGDFKGWANNLAGFALCQPTARPGGTPPLAPGCWNSKAGQSGPPSSLPEYIGVLVTDAVAKDKGALHGNVAALAVVRVHPEPAYGPVPGKPGFGTLVAIIDGGPLFPPPVALVASQKQPEAALPGQAFAVSVKLRNPTQTPAASVTVSERFEGSLPSSAEQAVGTIAPSETRQLEFARAAPTVAPRGEDEPVDAYQARLAAEDGRTLASLGTVRFTDPTGTQPSLVELFSASRLQLPRLSLALSAPSCAGPCTTVSYVLTVNHLGLARAASATLSVVLPDGSPQALELGALEPGATVTRTVEWTVTDPGPRRPEESVVEYLARLQAFTAQGLTVSARLAWTDELGNAYGPIGQESAPEARMAIPMATAAAPAPVLPGQSFPLSFTVTNAGNLRADAVFLRLEQGGAAPPFPLAPGESTLATLEATAPTVARKGSAEPDAAYRARLEALNGQLLDYAYRLEWSTPCGGLLGPLPGHVRPLQILPVLAVTMEGPAEARAGDTLQYTVTLRNTGRAEATGLALTLRLPSGAEQQVLLPVSALPPGGFLQVPVSDTLPLGTPAGQVLAVASLRWLDALANEYGPLSASVRTEVRASNQPPVVDAGPDQSITLPAQATMAGTVTDDGLPVGGVLRSSWVQVSGPDTVWFEDATSPGTRVTFPQPGTYVLRLSASDSQLTASDELTVVVLPRAGNGTTIPAGTPTESEVLINVIRDDGQIRLDDTTRAFNFIWVAVSSKGTVVKLDTETGKVLGEYWTSPTKQAKDPSRTTVDKNGNVWATNRNGNSVVHIGLVENGQCVDRNGNGVIDTSTGQGDIKPWPNTGGADTLGGVATAQDECILHYVRVTSSGTRHVSVTQDNDVWVSGTGKFDGYFDLIDGRTGVIKRRENGVRYGGYGGLIDKNGVIWSARPLLRWDTSKPLSGPNGGNWRGYSHDSYGLCIDSQGNVWNTSLYGGKIHKFAPDGTLLGSYWHGYSSAQGCVVDRNDDVWVAHVLWGSSTVGHLKNDGTYVGKVSVPSGPTGVAVDGKGKIWATSHNARQVVRIDPLLGPIGADGKTPVGAVDFTSGNLGGTLYNYSDMTGSTLKGAPDNGTWSVVYDTGVADSEWGKATWTGQVCGDGSLTVTAASSADGITYSAPVPVRAGVDFDVPNGRYLKVNVAFRRSSKGESPFIHDLTVATAAYVMAMPVNAPPHVDAGGDRTGTYPNPVKLSGSACDDTLPSGGALSYHWSQVSGPGTATFSAPDREVTPVIFSAPGTYVVRLTASDGELEGHADATLTVEASNLPPEVAVDSPKSTDFPPGSVVLTGTVTDDGLPAGSAVTVEWSKLSGPGTVTFEDAAQVPTTATFSEAGTYVVRLTASDGALSRSQDVLVQVGGAAAQNQPPQVSAGHSWSLTLPARMVTLQGAVSDDGQPAGVPLEIIWSVLSGPGTVTFGTPKAAQTTASFSASGTYRLRLMASDSQLAGTADTQVVVLPEPPPNTAPRVDAGPERMVALPPGLVTLTGRMLDDGRPEGGTPRVEWRQTSGPAPVTFATPDQLETQVGFTLPGSYTLVLWATDSELSASDAVKVEVSPDLVNAPPVVSAAAPASIGLQQPAFLSGTVYDEGLPATGTLAVAWSVVSGPGTVDFSTPAQVATRAAFSAAGTYVLRLTATDSELSASSDVTIEVLGDNQAPQVWAGGDRETQERTVTLSGAVGDDGLPLGAEVSVSWSVLHGPGAVTFGNPAAAVTTATFSEPGEYVLRLTASDSELSASSDARVRILPPQVALDIPGWIASPLNQSTVSGAVPIQLIQEVTLVEGTLDYWPADNPSAVTVLAEGVSGPGGSTLATLDTTRLDNGPFIIRLRGTNSEGVYKESGVLVTVSGGYKPGRVAFTVYDVTVPLVGIPVSIGRSYDSLHRERVGDFGYGWSLATRSTQLEVSPAHDVTFTRPDGKRVTFFFQPRSVGGVFGFLLEPHYLPQAGVYGSLTANGCPLLVSSGGTLVCFLDSNPTYSPTLFVYTDPRGRKYTMGADGQLRAIQELDGAQLTFTSEGITSNRDGRGVTFLRDGSRRITEVQVKDPQGQVVSRYGYTYDSQGDLVRVTLPAPRDGEPAPIIQYLYQPAWPHLIQDVIDPRGIKLVTHEYYTSPPALAGRLKSATTWGDGNTPYTFHYAYDLDSNTITTTQPDGGRVVERYTRMPAGTGGGTDVRLLSRTEDVRIEGAQRLTRTTRYGYDTNLNLRFVGFPDPATGEPAPPPSSPDTCARRNLCYAYDAQGNPTVITDLAGRVNRIEYNSAGRPTKLIDPLGNARTLTYDAIGNLTQASDAQGPLGGLSRDAFGNIQSHYVGSNPTHAATYTYDAFGNRESSTDPVGTTTYMGGYDSFGRASAITAESATGSRRLTMLSHDALGSVTRISSLTDSQGDTLESVRYEYDATGNRTAEVDELTGWRTEHEYDVLSRVTATRRPDGSVTRYTYDWRGNVLTETDSTGTVIRYNYDLAGALVSVTSGEGTPHAVTVRTEYDLAGRIVRQANGAGDAVERRYNDADQPLELIDPANGPERPTRLQYDGAGRLAVTIDPHGQQTRYTYDARGFPTAVTYATGATNLAISEEWTVRREHDGQGNVTRITDAAGRSITYTYDAVGQLTSVTNPMLQTTSYSYDGFGNLASITDALGRVTRFEYDAMSRPTRKEWPDGSFETFTYDVVPGATPVDSLMKVAHRLADGSTNVAYYDSLGELVRVEYADGRVARYRYDSRGLQREARDESGTTCYEYDALARLVEVASLGTSPTASCDTSPRPQRVTYAYDAEGRRTRMSTTVDGDTRHTSYTYDPKGRLCGVTLSATPAPCGTHSDSTFSFAYDESARTRTLTYPNGVTSTSTYDSQGQLVRVDQQRGGQTLASYVYTTDASGRRTRMQEADGSVTTWEYDDAHRLLREEHRLPSGTVDQVVRYTYDAVGSRLTQVEERGPAPLLTSYTYAPNGLDQLEHITLPDGRTLDYEYDARGNLLSDGEATYTYDSAERLVRIQAPGRDVHLGYDPHGRRIRQSVNGVETRMVWDETSEYGDIVAETDADGHAHTHYTPVESAVLARHDAQGTDYHLRDGQGSTRTLVDESGAPVEQYAYDAFGALRSGPASPKTPYLYTGQRLEPTSGLYDLRARWYVPDSGRFQSRDFILQPLDDASQFNRYTYAANDPINQMDPTGLMAEYAGTNKTSEEQSRAHARYVSGQRPSQGADTAALIALSTLSATADQITVSTFAAILLHQVNGWTLPRGGSMFTFGLGTVYHLSPQAMPKATKLISVTKNRWKNLADLLHSPAELVFGLLESLVMKDLVATLGPVEIDLVRPGGSPPNRRGAYRDGPFPPENSRHAEILIVRRALARWGGYPCPHRFLDVATSIKTCSHCFAEINPVRLKARHFLLFEFTVTPSRLLP